jgi:hypothetical protein
LDQEIETNLKLSELSEDDIDIEYECFIKNSKVVTHTSFLAFHQNAFSVDATHLSISNLNTSTHTMKSNSSIPVIRAPQTNLNSKCDSSSLPITQQPMKRQSYPFNPHILSNLGGMVGIQSGFPDDTFPNSDAEDEITINYNCRSTHVSKSSQSDFQNSMDVDDSDGDWYGSLDVSSNSMDLDEADSQIEPLDETISQGTQITINSSNSHQNFVMNSNNINQNDESDSKIDNQLVPASIGSPLVPDEHCASIRTHVVNGVQLTKLGVKNRDKLIDIGQYPDGPSPKKCQTCDESMDWRTSGTLMGRKNKNGILTHYTYANAHNSICVKLAFSDANNQEVSPSSHHRQISPITYSPPSAESHPLCCSWWRY